MAKNGKAKIKVYKIKLVNTRYTSTSKKTGTSTKTTGKTGTNVLTYRNDKGRFKQISYTTKLLTNKGYKKEAINSIAKKYNLSVNEITNRLEMLKAEGKKTNIKLLMVSLSNSKVERFLTAMGINYKEFVKELQAIDPNTTEEWINDSSHWTGLVPDRHHKNMRTSSETTYQVNGPLLLANGQRVEFNWNYEEGSTWEVL